MNLSDLRKLCDEATPGPWVADHGVFPYEGEHQGKTSRTIYHFPSPHHTVEVVESPDDLHGECIPNEADWRFIAAARTYLPKLIEAIVWADEIYRLSERNADVWNAYKGARAALEAD